MAPTSTVRFAGVRALVFDLDGTLIDSKLDLIHSVNATLTKMGRAKLSDEVISSYIGHGAPMLMSRALGGVATEDELSRGLKYFLAYYEEHKLDNTCLYPGVAETLADLGSRHRLILMTKGDHAEQADKLARSGLAPLFNAVEIVPEKDPPAYHAVIARPQVQPIANRNKVAEAVDLDEESVQVDNGAAHIREGYPAKQRS